jgi:hypothetical protein
MLERVFEILVDKGTSEVDNSNLASSNNAVYQRILEMMENSESDDYQPPTDYNHSRRMVGSA